MVNNYDTIDLIKYQFNIMNQDLVDKYVDTHYQLYLIKKSIHRTHHMLPFVFDDSILEVLKPGIIGAMDSYNSISFSFGPFDFSSLTIKDIIKGYYDIFLIKNELTTLNAVSSKDLESAFTHEKWGKMIKRMIPEMKFDNIRSFFEILVRLQNKIDDVFEGYGLELPGFHTLEKKLIDLYVKTIETQRPFLPPIEQLAVNDTLYVVNFTHGDVTMKNQNELVYTNERPPPTVDIPMNFYRIMASEYGAIACTSPKETEKYMSIIDNFLKIQRKNTERNNKKIIKRIIATLLKKTRDFMKNKKGRIKTSVQKQKRFDQTDAHVHYVKDSKIILKNYYVYLTDDDSDEIYVGNPEFNVNLLHYIDFKIKNGVIEFNLEDIIKVIKHIKYVLFIDLSCSNGNVTNKESNNFKSLAKRIEGPSITKQMEMHLNLSPYNENREVNRQLNKSKKRRTKSLTLSLTLRSKSKKSKSKRSKRYASL